MIPKIMCKPPNPTAINVSPQPGGVNSATIPRTMKQHPMAGMILTEKIPPVTTPAPYNNSQIPGNIMV